MILYITKKEMLLSDVFVSSEIGDYEEVDGVGDSEAGLA